MLSSQRRNFNLLSDILCAVLERDCLVPAGTVVKKWGASLGVRRHGHLHRSMLVPTENIAPTNNPHWPNFINL